jgi:threonine synthase
VHHPAVVTRMHLTQAAGCSPIVTAWNSGQTQVLPVRPNTVAKSLAIGNPADGIYALRVLKVSEGSAYAVPEPGVAEGIKLLAETEGIFTETAGGVVISGLKHLAESGAIKPDELAIAYITGNGLKTLEVVSDTVNPLRIKPSMRAFEAALKEHNQRATGNGG